jgi:SAM-dependent methyltransferase
VTSATTEQVRRFNPRMIDTDWLVLRDLRAAIATRAPGVVRKGTTAVDFGCGSRPYEAIFTAAGVRYLGADFDSRGDLSIDAAGHLQAQDQSADLVLSFQVLEHVRDLRTYFSEVRRVLRQDGLLLLSTHGTWLFHPHPEDHRRWTRQGLCAEIAAHDFEVVDCVPVVGPLAWTTIVRLTCACYALRRIPLVGPALGHLLALVMNTRAWIEDMITPDWVKNDNACVYLVLARPARLAAGAVA